MRTLVALLACLAFAGCLAPPIAFDTEETVIHASPAHQNEAREALEVVRIYTPVIQRILGVESERPVIYLLDGELEGDAIGCFQSGDVEPSILIGTEALPFLRSTLVHELVHWNAMTTRWKSLPSGLQQGLAYWLQLDLVELRGRMQAWIDPPDRQLVRDVLTLSEVECTDNAVVSNRYSAALWIIAWLGLPRLTEVVERAEREHVETIPAEWIEAALPETLGRVEFLPLMELVIYDAQGTVLGSQIGSSGITVALPAGAASTQVRPLDLPSYEGRRMLFTGMSVQMPAPR